MKKPGTTIRRNGTIRCAIYTRKSSEEGLEQEFNSLQAQREACEAFINSQRHEGWVCLRAAYDDGGFSGATMDRPAREDLLTINEVEQGPWLAAEGMDDVPVIDHMAVLAVGMRCLGKGDQSAAW
jgi:hypothetical protein